MSRRWSQTIWTVGISSRSSGECTPRSVVAKRHHVKIGIALREEAALKAGMYAKHLWFFVEQTLVRVYHQGGELAVGVHLPCRVSVALHHLGAGQLEQALMVLPMLLRLLITLERCEATTFMALSLVATLATLLDVSTIHSRPRPGTLQTHRCVWPAWPV